MRADRLQWLVHVLQELEENGIFNYSLRRKITVSGGMHLFIPA
jgi:hypothetical protein